MEAFQRRCCKEVTMLTGLVVLLGASGFILRIGGECRLWFGTMVLSVLVGSVLCLHLLDDLIQSVCRKERKKLIHATQACFLCKTRPSTPPARPLKKRRASFL